jgi:hypothetical protein|tara:strand:- start:17347 stop:17775 length:429 start_codon:yes stop_codon:yes gene_type:complete
MLFTGKLASVEGVDNQRNGKLAAQSSRITSVAGPGGIRGSIEPIEGEETVFESLITMTERGIFQEHGSIAFGSNGNTLTFTTLGAGHIGPSAESGVNQGAVIFRVEGGEGQFEGATGLITSNFTTTRAGDVVDHQFGVIYTG